ncbi:MAG: Dyp-type peroxidase [Hymenobacter sp.]|nr:Dyp-type peroxidase [Hymenobacter sp.]
MNNPTALRPDKPQPRLDGPFQPGITDPQWPLEAPEGINPERYLVERAGRINPQRFLTIVAADVQVPDRDALQQVLRSITRFARYEMARHPVDNHVPVLEYLPPNYRVTVTVALGASLFATAQGDDRFQLGAFRPRWLKTMPRVTGDAYEPADHGTDFLFVIASDHPYVNMAIARSLIHGYVDKRLVIRRVEQGFSRPDKREMLRFDDGVDNLSNARDLELDRHVYIQTQDEEPAWCQNGTYLAWRKIRENLPVWEALRPPRPSTPETEPRHTSGQPTAQREPPTEQENMIGRYKKDSMPLSKQSTGPGGLTPVFQHPPDARETPFTAHIRKVQPRRQGLDLLGAEDLERRFLRRAYPYLDGLDENNALNCGLLFMAFARNLRKQFEWPIQMWQTNPDFPVKDTGIDALYGRGILSNITGGYYFCPAAPQWANDPDTPADALPDYLAAALFAAPSA